MEDERMEIDGLQLIADDSVENRDPSLDIKGKKPIINLSSKLKQPRVKRPLSLLVDNKTSKDDLNIMDVAELRKARGPKGNVFDGSKIEASKVAAQVRSCRF